jgi:hypothetical protein
MLRGAGDEWPRRRSAAAYVIAYAATLAAAMAPVIARGDVHRLWTDTIAYQAGRSAPFSIWGLWGGLGLEQHIIQAAAVVLAVAVAVVPRRRGTVEVAALAGAVLIAIQLTLTYWFYLYIVWFFAPALVAVMGGPVADARPVPLPAWLAWRRRIRARRPAARFSDPVPGPGL